MSKDLRNVDLNLLIVFNTLAEEEHLTKTAEKLHLSQPAVSNALSRLRELFNDELFVRAPKGMRPTPKAEQLKVPINQALGLIKAQFNDSATFDCATAKNRFTIAVNSYGETAFFPSIANRIREQAPNVILDIFPESDASTPELLRSGNLDIAIDYMMLPGVDLIHETIFKEELVVACAHNHPELGDTISLSQYKQLPQLSLHPRNHKGSHTEILAGKKQVNRNIVMSVSSLHSFAPLVAETDLICTLPKRLALQAKAVLPIRILDLPFALEPISIQMIYNKDQYNNSAHQWLRKQISQNH